MTTYEDFWQPIKEFPGYLVSDTGLIYSEKTAQQLSTSQTGSGTVKVNLMKDGHIQTRSVKTLVALEFVPVPTFWTIVPNTPINLDGDPWNNHYLNLAWRPRWFAWKYTRQFNEPTPPEYNTRILNKQSGVVYDSVMQAGVDDGVLWEYIYQSLLIDRPVFPTGATYTMDI